MSNSLSAILKVQSVFPFNSGGSKPWSHCKVRDRLIYFIQWVGVEAGKRRSGTWNFKMKALNYDINLNFFLHSEFLSTIRLLPSDHGSSDHGSLWSDVHDPRIYHFLVDLLWDSMSSLNSSKSSLPSLFLSNFSKTASICASVILREVFRNSALVRYPSLFLTDEEETWMNNGKLWMINHEVRVYSRWNVVPVIRIEGESGLFVQIRRRRHCRYPRCWTRRAPPSAIPRPNIHFHELLEIDATIPIFVVARDRALYPLTVWLRIE